MLWQSPHSPDVCSQCSCHALMRYGGPHGSASSARPALPRRRGQGGGAGRRWLLPTPRPSQASVGETSHMQPHEHWFMPNDECFSSFAFCSHGQLEMLTRDVLAHFSVSSFMQAPEQLGGVYHPSQRPRGRKLRLSSVMFSSFVTRHWA